MDDKSAIVDAFLTGPLDPVDIPSMLALFTIAIPAPQLERSIYVAPGAERYLRHLMDHPTFQTHEQLWGIKDDAGKLLAAAHTRTLPGRSHLNNYAVHPDYQRRGLGARMLMHWEAMARREGITRLTLDVDQENTEARRLYAKHCFVEARITYEFRQKPSYAQTLCKGIRLLEWPQALANLEIFSFGRFQVELEGELHSVDLTHKRFRVSSPNEPLLAMLRWMDPKREILLRSQDPEPPGAWTPTGALVLMIKELA